MTENKEANIIRVFEENRRYREIGTLEELKVAMKYVYLAKKHGTVGQVIENCVKYEEIGTPEECRAAMEKQNAMEPIRMDKCTCPSCGTHNEVWKKRRNTLPSDIVYCWHCGQAVEIKREL